MEQAGIYRITLYENKGLVFAYSDGSISAIANTGDILEIENSNCDTSEIKLTQKPQRNRNNKLRYKSLISYLIYDYSIEKLQLIETIKKSIYGWVAKIEFYNKNQRVIPSPLRLVKSSIDNNVSNSFGIDIENVVFGDAPIVFIETATDWILENGFWDGAGTWTSDGIWKTV